MEWKTLWHYQTVDFGPPVADLENIEQQLCILPTVSGCGLKIRFDNTLNSGDMDIESVAVSHADNVDETPALFGESTDFVISPGQTADARAEGFKVTAGERLFVSVRFRRAGGICGLCQTWAAGSWQTRFRPFGGEQWLKGVEAVPFFSFDIHEPNLSVGVFRIDVLTDQPVKTLAMFGDSITHMSYYTDALIQRILRECPGKYALLNCGLGGNRLCCDAADVPEMEGHSVLFGPAGYKRFESHVFGTARPDEVYILEGINDVCHGWQFGHPDETPTVEEYAGKCTSMINCAHAHGAGVFLCTVMPESIFENEPWYRASEELRTGINAWIRSQKAADGVIDFEALLSDPECENRLREGLSLDCLHPNEAGGALMASAIPLT